MPSPHSLPFCVKEKANNLKNEITEVEELDNWQPAVSLVHSVFPSGELRNLPERAESLDKYRKTGL